MGVRLYLTREEACEIAQGRLPDSVIAKVVPRVAVPVAPIPGQTNILTAIEELPCPPNPQD